MLIGQSLIQFWLQPWHLDFKVKIEKMFSGFLLIFQYEPKKNNYVGNYFCEQVFLKGGEEKGKESEDS
jgi:hypothetical protein